MLRKHSPQKNYSPYTLHYSLFTAAQLHINSLWRSHTSSVTVILYINFCFVNIFLQQFFFAARAHFYLGRCGHRPLQFFSRAGIFLRQTCHSVSEAFVGTAESCCVQDAYSSSGESRAEPQIFCKPIETGGFKRDQSMVPLRVGGFRRIGQRPFLLYLPSTIRTISAI